MTYRKLTELKKLQNNPRTIKKEDMNKLVQSVKENPDYFEARPLILSNRTGELVILGGNQRYEAARILGLDKVPTHLIENLTEEKEREITIRDNVANGEWDWDLIANEWDVQQLDDWGVDLPTDLLKTEVEEDEAPEVSSEPAVSKLGEIYKLGRHRVMCGDATKIEDVEKLMDGKKADMVFTDPPYGVDYEGVNNDDLKAEKLREFITSALSLMYQNSREGANAYVWHPDIHAYEFIGAFRDAGFIQAKPAIIQWVKDSLVLSQGDYHLRNEPCLYGWKAGGKRQRVTDRTQDTIWEYPKPKKADGHPTMKPIELCARAIKNSSSKDETIIDTFLGSGSTLIACEQTNRTCYGMELDPRYCDVIRKRYAKFIGKEEQWQEETPLV